MANNERAQSTGLQIFALKTMIVAGTFFSIFLLLVFFINANFQTGPAFWGKFEEQLYRMADDQDLPAEKKEKILAALRKIGTKYQPYFDALSGK